MLGTIALIIGVSSLGLATILAYTGSLNVYSLAITVVIFNVIQWLIAPYLVNALYKVRKLDIKEDPELHRMIDDLSLRSGIKSPKLMISDLQIPNAFAYGSPLVGNHVAVTKGLLTSLDREEVEAVIGHELGHIKHRDVQVTMIISVLPSLFYILARSTLFARYGNRDRRDSGGLAMIGRSIDYYMGIFREGKKYVPHLLNQAFFLASKGRMKEAYNYLWAHAFVKEEGAALGEPLYRRKPDMAPYPERIELEVSTQCSLRCLKCEHTYWNEEQKMMTMEQFEHILNQFPTLKAISLSGIGHGMERRDLVRLFRSVSKPVASWSWPWTRRRNMVRRPFKLVVTRGTQP